jgi:hypothetical protein
VPLEDTTDSSLALKRSNANVSPPSNTMTPAPTSKPRRLVTVLPGGWLFLERAAIARREAFERESFSARAGGRIREPLLLG